MCSSVNISQIVVWCTATGLLKSPCIAHQPDGIHPVQIHLIEIRDSPDHCSVRNKKVKFIRIDSLRPRFSVHCPHWRESVKKRVFLKKMYMYENFVRTLETVHNREVSVLRGSTVPSVWWYLCLEMRLINGILAWKQGCLGNTRSIILISWQIKKGAFMAIRRRNGKIRQTYCLLDVIYFLRSISKRKHLFISWNHANKIKAQSFEKSQGGWDLQVKFIEYIIIYVLSLCETTDTS